MRNVRTLSRLGLILTFSLCLISSCGTRKSTQSTTASKPAIESPKAVKLAPNTWASTQEKKAYELGYRLLNACNTSRFKGYTSSEASPELIQSMSPAAIEQTCRKFNLRYGTFKNMALVEVWHNPKNETHVYRFKPAYSKKIAQKELRVIMDKTNKMVALSTLDWDTNYQVNP